jgi:hypothetical protein
MFFGEISTYIVHTYLWVFEIVNNRFGHFDTNSFTNLGIFRNNVIVQLDLEIYQKTLKVKKISNLAKLIQSVSSITIMAIFHK